MTVLISKNIDFKSKMVKRQKTHYIMRNSSTHQEAITIANIYMPNIGTPKYIKQKLTDKKEKLTVI